MSASASPSFRGRKLPPSIVEAIQRMEMPLSPDSYANLYYKSLPEMSEIRRNQPTGATYSNSPLVQDVVGTIALVRGDGYAENTTEDYLSRCATGLILLGLGASDEAHDLVSPLSWPNELPFAYGPPVAVPEHVLCLASYVHALVHRREGLHPSEFGMKGFANADYWAGSALRSPDGAEALPLEEIRASIVTLATQHASYSQDKDVQDWVQQSVSGVDLQFPVWDPRVLNELCSDLYNASTNTSTNSNTIGSNSTKLQEFAEQAVLTEMRILLKHTLLAIGYEDCSA